LATPETTEIGPEIERMKAAGKGYTQHKQFLAGENTTFKIKDPTCIKPF